MLNHVNTAKLYQKQWKAYYKPGLGAPQIVYGKDENEALVNALAYFRKNYTLVHTWPRERIVDHVEAL